MPTYEFWYDETYTAKGWFTASEAEEAEDLLAKLANGDISFDDLPEFGKKDKNYTLETDELTEIGDN
jgi:hypothetical protein